ncbi:MAG TPA: MFS transporter [Mycobacteriales bacterium]|nr:MFS transporter [Mycobacteriales bacterium]
MRRTPLLLVATSLAAFTANLDNTVVAVALRDVQADLGSSVLGLQGVVTAYTVTLAALLLAGGALVDVLGGRRVLVLGVAVFAGASIGCAVAGSVGALVLWRVVQGVGASLLLPGSLAVLAQAHPDPVRRRRAVSVWAAVSGAALVAGPVIGGELVDRYGWPAVFWLNLPLCSLVLLLLVGPRESARAPLNGRVDVAGAALTCLALGSATYGVVLLGRHGLAWPAAVLLALAVLAALALRRVEATAPAPLLPRELLRDRGFRGATLAAFAAALAVFVLLVFVGLFLQLVHNHDARGAGRVLLALPVTLVLAALATSRSHRVVLPVLLGLLLAGAGLLGLAHAVREGVADGVVAGWLAVVGVGVGLTTAPVVATTLTAAGERRAGLAAASVTVARELGGVVAVAGLGALAVARLTDRLSAALVSAGVPGTDHPGLLDALLRADRPEVRRQLVESVGATRALAAYPRFQEAATASFVSSTRWVLAGAGLLVLALAGASALLLASDHRGEGVEEG